MLYRSNYRLRSVHRYRNRILVAAGIPAPGGKRPPCSAGHVWRGDSDLHLRASIIPALACRRQTTRTVHRQIVLLHYRCERPC
jgi:hypothetical protein